MEPIARLRDRSKVVAGRRACAPLKAAYDLATRNACRTWYQAEDLFLRGIEAFDANVAGGVAVMNDLTQGKAEFFHDLLALLLSNGADVDLYYREGIPGLVFQRHQLDIVYPLMGAVQFVAEGKAHGTPTIGGKGVVRHGATDLDTRLVNLEFQSIDLKAASAGAGQPPAGPSADLTSWLRALRPRTYTFLAVRVLSVNDRDNVVQIAARAALVTDGVGLFCYMPVAPDRPTTYKSVWVPEELAIGEVLARACRDLVEIRNAARPAPGNDDTHLAR